MIDSLYAVLIIVAAVVLLDYSVALRNIKVRRDGNNQEDAIKVKEKCAQRWGINMIDMNNAMITPEKYPSNPYLCAWACMFKKFSVLDSQGMYQPERAIKNIAKYSSSDQLGIHTLEIYIRCASVNMAPVSDGDRGCERARLLLNCLRKNTLNIHMNEAPVGGKAEEQG